MNTQRLPAQAQTHARAQAQVPEHGHGPAAPAPASLRKLAVALGAAALLLAGCADLPFFQRTQARNTAHPKATAVLERDNAPPRETVRGHGHEHDCDRDCALQKESADLREGIRLYNDGDFDGAIRRLSARELNNGPLSTRLAALKYTAFSYCVTSRPTQCRQSFDKALRLDPSFELSPGEEGHPLWGPVFAKARQAARTR